jgi:hypothetical protein
MKTAAMLFCIEQAHDGIRPDSEELEEVFLPPEIKFDKMR